MLIDTADKFTESVDRTFVPGHPLLAIACGLAGEAGEVLELWDLSHGDPPTQKVWDEMGDLHWYVAALARALGSSYGEVYRTVVPPQLRQRMHTPVSLSVLVSKVVDKIKKIEWHDRKELRDGLISDLAGIVWASCDCSHGHLGFSWTANHEKLLRRYPDGFVKGGGIR